MTQITSIALSILQFLIMLIMEFFHALGNAFGTGKKDDARFASSLSIANPFNKGIWIGKNRRLLGRKAVNVAIFGPPGSGKSSTLIFPNLYTLKKCSILISDISGELFAGASGYHSRHFNVVPIHLSDPKIGGYNPIINLKDTSEVDPLIDIVVDSAYDPNSSGDNFWALSVKTILTLLTKLVLHEPPHKQNFGYVLELLHSMSATSATVDKMFAQTNDSYLIKRYMSFIGNSEKTMLSILSTAKAALQLFDNPLIAQSTATTEKIDFDGLRREATVIYLLGSVATAQYTSVLVGLFFEQFYRSALERIPTKKELPLYVLLDETPAYYIKILPLALSNGRKHRISTLICCQNVNQLATRYGKNAENIIANCGVKIFLHSQSSLDDLRNIEALGGTRTVKDEHGNIKTVSLISAAEVRTLPKYRTIIIASNKSLIKGHIAPHWHNLNFRRYSKIPPCKLAK